MKKLKVMMPLIETRERQDRDKRDIKERETIERHFFSNWMTILKIIMGGYRDQFWVLSRIVRPGPRA